MIAELISTAVLETYAHQRDAVSAKQRAFNNAMWIIEQVLSDTACQTLHFMEQAITENLTGAFEVTHWTREQTSIMSMQNMQALSCARATMPWEMLSCFVR